MSPSKCLRSDGDVGCRHGADFSHFLGLLQSKLLIGCFLHLLFILLDTERLSQGYSLCFSLSLQLLPLILRLPSSSCKNTAPLPSIQQEGAQGSCTHSSLRANHPNPSQYTRLSHCISHLPSAPGTHLVPSHLEGHPSLVLRPSPQCILRTSHPHVSRDFCSLQAQQETGPSLCAQLAL